MRSVISYVRFGTIINFFTMKRRVFVSCLCAALLIAAGCKKDDSSGENKLQLITSAAWKYDTAAIDFNRDGTAETPLPPGFLAACDLDNTVTLNADSTGMVDEGATKCDAGDPQTVAISWSFKNGETVINIPDTIYGSISGDAQIKTLTATKLTLIKEVTIDDPFPATVNVIVDLKH